MEEELLGLDEIVVVGYGTVKKRDLTGSVASINAQKIQESPVMTAAQSLQGKIPGVLVTNSNWKPGSSASVLIRGTRSINASNDPLYVVDGIPMTGALDEIPPGDIESIDVLKDASATAIYGSRGANGVIIITTKKGKSGKVQVDYNGYYGFQTIQNKLELMDGAEYAEYIRESYRGAGQYNSPVPNKELDYGLAPFGGNTSNPNGAPTDPYTWESVAMAYDANGNYDPSKVRSGALWWNEVEQTGIVTDHQLGIRGGTDKTQFSFGTTYYRNEGIYKSQEYDRYSLRLNIDSEITSWLKFGGQSQFSHSINKRGTNFQDNWRVNPLGRLYDDDGMLTECTSGVDVQWWNPLQYLQKGAVVNPKKVNRFFGSYYGEIKLPLEGLSYRLNAGVDYYSVDDYSFASSMARQGQVNQARNSKSNTYVYTIENLLFYNKEVGEHSFGATLLQSVQRSRTESLNATVQDLPSDDLLYNDIASALTISGYDSNNQVWSLASYMGRLNYNYKSRYYATLSMRYDGSSRLADGYKWVSFPAFALAWRINEESFLKNYNNLNNLKLRFGYGVTANSSISPYQTKGLLSKIYYNYGTTYVIGYAPGSLPDKTLTWETTGQWNLGLDFGLYKGRLSGTIDAYIQNTHDLLLNRQLPVVSGYSSVLTNIGKTKNKGLEISLSTINIEKKNFNWSTSFTYSTNKEEIVELYNGKNDDIGNKWFIGEAIRVYYDYKKTGIWQDTPEDRAEMEKFNVNGHKFVPGTIKLLDIDGDYKISADNDRMILGHKNPSHILSMSNTFYYKDFDLNLVMYGTLGGMLENGIRYNHQSDRNSNVKYNYWTAQNPTNDFPQPNRLQANIDYESTLYYEKSDFLRIKTITFGYTLPQRIANKASLSRCRLYFTAQNPFVFSKFNGVDPEGATTELGSGTSRNFASPSVSSWIFGLNISL
jgi:TonB-linked SusC/RagA family outer membrane protein